MPTIEPELQPTEAPTPAEVVKTRAVGALPQFAFTVVGCISGFFIATPIVLRDWFGVGLFLLPVLAVIIGLILGGLYTHLARQRGMALIGVVSVIGVALSIALAWMVTAVVSYIH
jgi:uncharacterized membrane protein YoaK (UPF0700 family)